MFTILYFRKGTSPWTNHIYPINHFQTNMFLSSECGKPVNVVHRYACITDSGKPTYANCIVYYKEPVDFLLIRSFNFISDEMKISHGTDIIGGILGGMLTGAALGAAFPLGVTGAGFAMVAAMTFTAGMASNAIETIGNGGQLDFGQMFESGLSLTIHGATLFGAEKY